MLRTPVIILTLLSASPCLAADIVPTQFRSYEEDLGRASIRVSEPGSARIGLRYVSGQRYTLDPVREQMVSSSSVRQELNLTTGLPWQAEFGLGLSYTREAVPAEDEAAFGAADPASNGLGAALWLRMNVLNTKQYRSSIVLQYEPGIGSQSAFHQPSQDKTGLAASFEWQPHAWLQSGIFAGFARRKDEVYRTTRLNDEILYGIRVGVGPSTLQFFADVEGRILPWKTSTGKAEMRRSRIYEAGISTMIGMLQLSASAFVPGTERYPGVPERGVRAGLTYLFAEPQKLVSKPKKKIVKDKSFLQADGQNPFSTVAPQEGVGAAPFFPPARQSNQSQGASAGALETSEADEFQLLEKRQNAEAKRKESAAEIAERELKAQYDQEKADEAKRIANEAKSKKDEKSVYKQQIKDDENAVKNYKDDIEKELNEYTLSGSDELNWKGLE